jgi:hypothetical protein
MTLAEISITYASSASAIRTRILELRRQELAQTDPEAARLLRCRINALLPLWRDMRELTAWTAHYYDRRTH